MLTPSTLFMSQQLAYCELKMNGKKRFIDRQLASPYKGPLSLRVQPFDSRGFSHTNCRDRVHINHFIRSEEDLS
jgi:hypothetical protein